MCGFIISVPRVILFLFHVCFYFCSTRARFNSSCWRFHCYFYYSNI